MQPQTQTAARALLVAVVAAGLGVDAWSHLSLAADYDPVRSSVLSQGDLFRAEGAMAILAAGLLLLWPRRRWTAVVACVTGVGGLAAVLVYQYVDVGAIGPLPNMYEPIWYAKKTESAWGEGAAAVAGFALVLLVTPLRYRPRMKEIGSS